MLYGPHIKSLRSWDCSGGLSSTSTATIQDPNYTVVQISVENFSSVEIILDMKITNMSNISVMKSFDQSNHIFCLQIDYIFFSKTARHSMCRVCGNKSKG